MSYLNSLYKKLDNDEFEEHEGESEAENEEKSEDSMMKKKQINPEQKSKFDLLKQKRQTIKEKFDKKMKKLKSKEKLRFDGLLTRQTTAGFKEINDLNESNRDESLTYENDAKSKEEQESIEDLERRIDEALKSDDIEMAEKISDEISSKQFKDLIQKANEAERFKLEQKVKELAQRKKKPKMLNWRFEAKKRWETKSNM